MALLDGIKNTFGMNNEQQIPILPPGNPEYQGMYAQWEAEDMTGTVGIALDNSSLISNIESYLSGKVLVNKTDIKTGRKYVEWEQMAEPKMNEKGVRAILLEVRAQLDKNTIMTFFPNIERLDAFMMQFGEDLFFFLGQNMREFEIKPSHASQMGWFIIRQVYITLLRGLEGNEKQGVYKQYKRIENATIPLNSPQFMQQPKGGMFK